MLEALKSSHFHGSNSIPVPTLMSYPYPEISTVRSILVWNTKLDCFKKIYAYSFHVSNV